MSVDDETGNETEDRIPAAGDDAGLEDLEPAQLNNPLPPSSQHHSLKYRLLGPSLTKAGQDTVDQTKVSEIIYEASKGSKYFNNEEAKDKSLTVKIERILKLKAQLEKLDLRSDLRRADDYITCLDLSRDLSQYVVHIDCDAFYAAVEEIDRPELKEVPMAVGIGVLTTCNYQARKFGCRSAMAGFVAKKLCPQLICLPLNFDKYNAKAKEVRAILAQYDPRFESSSIDEAYLNITEYCAKHDIDPDSAVEQLRFEVAQKCKITISAGIAPNAKIAKICSNKNKPNGQFRVPNDRAAVISFMSVLPVRKVNGIGKVFERELDAIGIRTCGDIYAPRAYLDKLFGEKAFQFLIQSYLGMGRTEVQPAEEYERKSVGTESTFREISAKADLRERLRRTAEELQKDMTRAEVKGRTLVLKVKLHTFDVLTRQVAPPKAVHLADDLYNYSLPMLAKLEKEIPDFKLRLMGLRCTHLISTKKDTENFFKHSLKPRSSTTDNSDGEWEVWPDAEFEAAARQERQDEMDEMQCLSQEYRQQLDVEQKSIDESASETAWHAPFGRYKPGSHAPSPTNAPNATMSSSTTVSAPQVDAAITEDQQWDCPICHLPQQANDRAFNTHIDVCLSRQTIKDAVAEATPDPEPGVDAPSRPRSAAGTKRKGTAGGNEATNSHRQKRLFFS